VLQWMGRLYVLTDLRIMRLAGVFHVDVFECPLRKVARTLLDQTVRDRLLQIGTITIIPEDEQSAPGQWLLVSRPARIHDRVQRAVARAKQGPPAGSGG
jgi:hypothetical protein